MHLVVLGAFSPRKRENMSTVTGLKVLMYLMALDAF